MEHTDYLIIGGGIAGTAAAEAIRNGDPTGRILMIASEPHQLYSRVLLPRYLAGTLDRTRLFLRPVDHLATLGIDSWFGETVTNLEPVGSTVTCATGRRVRYDRLLIATGGAAIWPTVPGSTLPGVLTFKTIDDADAIAAAAQTHQSAVVVGGGFIAMELVDALCLRGLQVTAALREQWFWQTTLGSRGGQLIHSKLERRDVRVLPGRTLTAVAGTDAVTAVTFDTGETVPTSLVLVGIGQRCVQPWMVDAGLTTAAGGIETNEYLETNLPNVFAAGDVAAFFDPLAGHHHRLGNWLNAQIQGMLVGATVTGHRQPLRSVTLYRADHHGLTTLFIGDLQSAGRTIVERIDESDRFGRFFFSGRVLVGAALINITDVIQSIQAAILAQRVFKNPASIATASSVRSWIERSDPS